MSDQYPNYGGGSSATGGAGGRSPWYDVVGIPSSEAGHQTAFLADTSIDNPNPCDGDSSYFPEQTGGQRCWNDVVGISGVDAGDSATFPTDPQIPHHGASYQIETLQSAGWVDEQSLWAATGPRYGWGDQPTYSTDTAMDSHDLYHRGGSSYAGGAGGQPFGDAAYLSYGPGDQPAYANMRMSNVDISYHRGGFIPNEGLGEQSPAAPGAAEPPIFGARYSTIDPADTRMDNWGQYHGGGSSYAGGQYSGNVGGVSRVIARDQSIQSTDMGIHNHGPYHGSGPSSTEVTEGQRLPGIEAFITDFNRSFQTDPTPWTAAHQINHGNQDPSHPHDCLNLEAPEPRQLSKPLSQLQCRPNTWNHDKFDKLRNLKGAGKNWNDIGAEMKISGAKCMSQYRNLQQKEKGLLQALALQQADSGHPPTISEAGPGSSQAQEVRDSTLFGTVEGSPNVFYVNVKAGKVDWKTPGLISWAYDRAKALRIQQPEQPWFSIWNMVAGLINHTNHTSTTAPTVACHCGYSTKFGPESGGHMNMDLKESNVDIGEPHADG